jgi:hypothetical protein
MDNSDDANVSFEFGRINNTHEWHILRYLRSMLQSDRGINEDVSYRISAGWVK